MDVYDYDNLTGNVLTISSYTIQPYGNYVSNGVNIPELDAYNDGVTLNTYKNGVKVFPGHLTTSQLADAKGRSIRGRRAPIPAIGGLGLSLSDVTLGNATGATISLTTGPNGQPAIKIVTDGTGVRNPELIFPGLVGAIFNGDASLIMHGSYTDGNLEYVALYVSQDDATYAKSWNEIVQYGLTTPLNTTKEQGGAVGYFFSKGAAGRNAVGSPTYPAVIGQCKVRFAVRNNVPGTFYIYGFGVSTPRPKGRICVTFDDGYDSMFKLGYESFASRGIPLTLGVIGSAQGTGSGFSNINQLRSFVDAGNALVPHGPWPNQGAGNLFSAYPGSANPVADAVNDRRLHLNYLRSNGLLVEAAERCYIWPQGQWQQSVNDTSVLAAFYADGATVGRGTTQLAIGTNFDALPIFNRMCLPNIGHLWSGTTAAETTNITNVSASIASLASNKTDGILMLHRVLPTATNDAGMGAASNITIRYADLETLAAAIKTAIDAGTLEAVTMPQLALATPGFWQV